MTRRRPPCKRLSAAGEPMNEAELIKKIKACLAKGKQGGPEGRRHFTPKILGQLCGSGQPCALLGQLGGAA